MRSSVYHTETKEYVVSCLKQQQGTALSVQAIMEYLQTHHNTANITTVYRILDRLENEHTVIKHSAEDGKKALFQYVAPDAECMHHLHVQCTSCGKIIHLDCSVMKEAIEHISEEHGMQITCSASLLYGICSDCLEKQKAAKELPAAGAPDTKKQ
jgi:Fur family transcriptional regulator, ferric uptake regulator